MKQILSFSTLFAFALLSFRASFANNTYFLPGDAFFSTELTQEQLAAIDPANASSHTFQYANFGTWEMAFCGHAGYPSATIEQLDEKFIKNLKLAHAAIRENYPCKTRTTTDFDNKTTTQETNPIRIFFYRENFSYGTPSKWPKHKVLVSDSRKPVQISPPLHLGLKYNENWADETVKFGHHRDRIRMCQMVNHPDAIMSDWRDATFVKGLKFLAPIINKDEPSGYIDTPIKITGKIKAIVIPSISLEKYFSITRQHSNRLPKIQLPVFYVTTSGFKKTMLPAKK